MSGIAVIYNLGERAVEHALLSSMIGAMPYRSLDGSGVWIDGSIGLAHARTCTTPESIHEVQPLRDERAGLALVLDGRVDNREDLIAQLTSKGYRLRDDTDAEIVLRSYECWGEDSPARIIGDFAYAIWDSRARHLFCARDVLGAKPFNYFNDGRVFLAGSELHQILGYPGVPREPNEGMVAEILAATLKTRDETLYRNVMRLVPGCVLVVKPGNTRSRRYYDLRNAKEVRYATDDQYAEHFRDTFAEATRCMLRSSRPVLAQLSGGLDSSSVVAMSAHLIRSGAVTDIELRAASVVFAELESDEREYIAQVETMWGIKSLAVPPRVPDLNLCIEQVHRYKNIPDYANGTMIDFLRQAAREQGIRVCLTGIGADEWLTGGSYRFADYIRQFQFGDLLRDLRAGRPVLDHGRPTLGVSDLRNVLRWGVWPLVSPLLGAQGCTAVRRLIGRDNLPSFVGRPLIDRVDLRSRLSLEPIRRTLPTFADQTIYDLFNDGWVTTGREITERTASWYGLEERSPFLDRRLAEYVFGIPQSQRFDPPVTKIVMRNAMKGLVPESIRMRRSKAEFSHIFANAIERSGGESFFSSLEIASRGWVDSEELKRAAAYFVNGYRSGNRHYNTYVWQLWAVLGIELWFREVFGAQSGHSDVARGSLPDAFAPSAQVS
jgi:asparagine synthase (glutamine-hydrolysing)